MEQQLIIYLLTRKCAVAPSNCQIQFKISIKTLKQFDFLFQNTKFPRKSKDRLSLYQNNYLAFFGPQCLIYSYVTTLHKIQMPSFYYSLTYGDINYRLHFYNFSSFHFNLVLFDNHLMNNNNNQKRNNKKYLSFFCSLIFIFILKINRFLFWIRIGRQHDHDIQSDL